MSKGMSAEGFSENEKLILYLFAFERDTRRPSDFSWLLRSRFGKGVSVAELERICSRLAARGHIERLASGSSGSGSLYRFSGLSFGDARRILADAASNGWLLPDSASERVLDLHKEKKAIAEDVLDGASSSPLTHRNIAKELGTTNSRFAILLTNREEFSAASEDDGASVIHLIRGEIGHSATRDDRRGLTRFLFGQGNGETRPLVRR